MIALIEPIQSESLLLQEVDKIFIQLYCKMDTLTPSQQSYVELLRAVFVANDDYNDMQIGLLFANVIYVTHPLIWENLPPEAVYVFHKQLIAFQLL